MPARRSRRHGAAGPGRRRTLWLASLLSLPVVVIVGFFLVKALGPQATPTASAASTPTATTCASSATAKATSGSSAATAQASAVTCAQPLVAASAASASSPTPSASATPSATPSAAPSAAHTTAAAPPPSHAAAPTSAAPPAVTAGSQQGAPADQILAVINQARVAAGLPAYTMSSGLDLSATRHNTVMASGCGLSHQCPGEAALGARETAAGVTWTSAGENIGEGGPVSDTTAAIGQIAVTLTQDMLAEKPPDDGYRLNILSSAFHHIGIAVFRDSSGTVWMTQDFSN
jgi:uncharacterized protein YkwD